MSDLVKVAVDAMGGDNAPSEIVKGAVLAVQEDSSIKVYLVGQEEVLKKELAQYPDLGERIEIAPASEVITNEEAPVMAVRRKKILLL